MNIGIFTDTYYPEINGVANSAYQLKQVLESRGHLVYIFTVSHPKVKIAEDHIYRMGSVPFLLLKDRRVSYSLTHNWLKKAKKLQLDIIHTQTEFSVGRIGRQISKKLNIPLVHTYHTLYEDYTHYLKFPENQKIKDLVQQLSKSCCDKAECVVVPTKKVKRLLQKYGVEKEIIIQPTGINAKKFENPNPQAIEKLKKTFNLKDEDHLLLSIGRLSQEKNIDELINLVALIYQVDPKVKLLIVGNGPERTKLMKLAEERGLASRIIFTGEIEWSEIQNYYALGNVFVSASTSETQGLTYLEALSAGKPLLVRKDECLDEILVTGKNGYSYETANDFQDAYLKLFVNKLPEEMVAFSKDVAAGLSMESFGLGIEKIYENIILKKSIYLEGCENCEPIHRVV